MKIEEAIASIRNIWKEHAGAVLLLDGAPVLKFEKNTMNDHDMYVVLLAFINQGKEAYFDYYD